MSPLENILKNKLVAILRGYDTAEVLEIIQALYDGGIRLVEVTLNSTNALKSIEKAKSEFGGQMEIGAGTVLNAKSAKKAITAGASFIISPTFDFETIAMTKQMGAVSIPGAFSPTEIYQAHQAGADIVKIFPSILGPDYIKNVLGPLDEIRLMPTGGVKSDNITAYLEVGAVAFGIGGGLLNTLTGLDPMTQISKNAAEFVEALNAN